jgi:hypothetical protein
MGPLGAPSDRSAVPAVPVELQRRQRTSDGERDDHREDVVRRLLLRGVSPRALRALLPAWDDLITRIVEEPLPPDGPSTSPWPGPAGHPGDTTS